MTARVARGDIEHRVIATGRIEPYSKIEIRSKVDGIIKTVTVEEGDPVHKDKVLIQLDKDILATRVTEARAALERARASYEQARIEASDVGLEAARRKYERARKLFERGLAPEQQFEDAETALAVAEQNYRARQAVVSMAKAELSAAAAAPRPKILGTPEVSLFTIGGSVVVMTLIGLLAGTLPAVRAAGLDPVEALRYE